MDISSELIHSLLPLFMATVLGASMMTIGVIEGVAESTAMIIKVFSGALSDRLGRRKGLTVLGYGLATLSKPLFALATTIGWVFTARFIDRIGKGIREAPREALVADLAPAALRGAAYGLRQSLDSIGAFVGPLLAVLCMLWLANDLRAVLWIALLPALIAVALLVFGVHEPPPAADRARLPRSLNAATLRRLPRRYWLIILFVVVFTLARFSDAFLVLRAHDVGLALGYVPVVMIAMNVVYALSAYPAGAAADRISPRWLLACGLVMLIAADLLLAVAATPLTALIGAALWGLHMGLTQGLLSKLVADAVPVEMRGTAFGIVGLTTGVAVLLASVIAGALWSAFAAAVTFYAGALFAALALLGLTLTRTRLGAI
ncbi:MAG: MFS transporter [Gammaproteobacteria bacterium]|nr:MFS transporter [Gammaproteobacteria bacterium]